MTFTLTSNLYCFNLKSLEEMLSITIDNKSSDKNLTGLLISAVLALKVGVKIF